MAYAQFRNVVTGRIEGVTRDADGAFIPEDPGNADWQAYQAWLNAGNEPVLRESALPSELPNGKPDA